MPKPREVNVEDKLRACSSKTRETFARVEAKLAPSTCETRVESGPGRRYLDRAGHTVARVHPKIEHVCIGFPNTMREMVAATGLLRAQRNAAWVNVGQSTDWSVIEELLRRACAGASGS